MAKDSTRFWRSSKSKFDHLKSPPNVNGENDPKIIVSKFKDYFSDMVSAPVSSRSEQLKVAYADKRVGYAGDTWNAICSFSVETVSRCLNDLKKGKACGLDLLCAEHLQYAHPSVVVILTKLFNLLLVCEHVPYSFCSSYIVPLPKCSSAHGATLQCSDYRGISISTAFSKLFEKSVLLVFGDYFSTNSCQFGFKKALGCSHAILAVKSIVDSYCLGNTTANICTLDISRAFPSINHCCLFLKLMSRDIPVCVLGILEHWYTHCFSCVKWNNLLSDYFQLYIGVMQGSCLAPALFAICIDDVIIRCILSGSGSIIVYADDIILISRSVSHLQRLVDIVNDGLNWIDLHLNVKKSFCLRVGSRFSKPCANINVGSHSTIGWCSRLRYLGVYINAGRKFNISLDEAKKAFNRAANSVLSKLGIKGKEACIAHLINVKCSPILLYGLEACDTVKSAISSLDFCLKRFVCKIFRTVQKDVIDACVESFGIKLPSELVPKRVKNFASRFMLSDNWFCRYAATLKSIVGCSSTSWLALV
jgi:hypothetical protein